MSRRSITRGPFDITERKRAEKVMQARLRMAAAAYTGEISVDSLLRLTLDELEALTGSQIGFYHYLEEDQETLALQNWSTNTVKTMCTAEGSGSHYNISRAGVWVDCVRERRPVIHNDYVSLPHRKGMPPGHAPVIREMVVPIMRGDRIMAIIGIGNKKTDYNTTDIEIAQLLGDFSWEIVERKRAEEALHASSERYRSYVEVTKQLEWTTNADGEVVEDLPSWRKYTGQTYEEIKGWGWSKALHPGDLEHAAQAWKNAITAKSNYEVEYRIRRQDGIYRHFLARGVPVLKEDRSVREWVGTCVDITERKKAEEALRQSEESLRGLNEDLEMQVSERTRFYYILARTNEAIVRISDRQSLFDEVCRIIVEEGSFKLAWVGILDPESRAVRPVASFGESAYLAGIKIIAADVPEGKGPTGRAVFEDHYAINTDFEKDLNLLPWREKARAHGLRSSSAFPLHTGGQVIGALTIYSDKPSFFNDEEVDLLISLCENVSFALDSMETEKKRSEAEEDLRRLNEELEQRVRRRTAELEDANKELESFIYSVSHDLRAPLRSMSGFATFLTEDCGEQIDDRGRDYLARIRKGAVKMSQLIEDLLNLSRITRKDIEKSAIDMSALASSIVSNLRESNPGREVSVSLQQGLTALADPRLMEIALSNLFGNAWKFTAKEENPRVEFGAVEKGGNTVYYVRDNGAGFDNEYIEKMFRPFQRLHSEEEFEGTGVGLAIVERIIHRHGGRIWAEGEKGKGATVFFTID